MIGIDGMLRCRDNEGRIVIGTQKDIEMIMGAVPQDADGAVMRMVGGYIFEGDIVEWQIPTYRGGTIINIDKLKGVAKLIGGRGAKPPDSVIDVGGGRLIPAWQVNLSMCKISPKI